MFVRSLSRLEEAWEKGQRSTCYRGDFTNPLQNMLREGNGVKEKRKEKAYCRSRGGLGGN